MATLRQKRVVDKLVADGGSVADAMRSVGYSEAMARNSQKLTSSPTFLELFEARMPDKYLQNKHKEFLDSPKLIRRFRKGEIIEEVTETDSNAVRALDMAYKLKGLYKSNDSTSTTNTLVINLSPEASQRYAPSIAPVTVQSTAPVDTIEVDVIDTTPKIVKEKVHKKVRDNE